MAGVTLFDAGGCGCPYGGLHCAPCNIPEQDLTLSYVNTLGNGSESLVYSAGPPAVWNTGCMLSHWKAVLKCDGIPGVIILELLGYASGCIGGPSSVYDLTIATYTCSPFYLTYTVDMTLNPDLWAAGFRSFTVTL